MPTVQTVPSARHSAAAPADSGYDRDSAASAKLRTQLARQGDEGVAFIDTRASPHLIEQGPGLAQRYVSRRISEGGKTPALAKQGVGPLELGPEAVPTARGVAEALSGFRVVPTRLGEQGGSGRQRMLTHGQRRFDSVDKSGREVRVTGCDRRPDECGQTSSVFSRVFYVSHGRDVGEHRPSSI